MSSKFDFFVPKDKTECEYIGYDAKKRGSTFVFPCRYFDGEVRSGGEPDYKSGARDIIFLLKRVRQEYNFGGSTGEFRQFQSMLWLMQDYIDNGCYVETETVYKNNGGGRINWKKTIKQNNILFDNGNIVYPSFVRNRVTTDESRIITQIYKACLARSVEELGFIYGLGQTERSLYDVDRDKDFLVYYLTSELNSTFRDYKKTLLNHLLAIVNNRDNGTKSLGFSIYDSEFEYVFEFLVNRAFGTEDVKRFYNTYSYYLPQRVPSSRLRPDTVMKDEKNKMYYIIDSKYYNYGYTRDPKDLPAASSVSKQIGYNHYLRDNLPEAERNAGYRVKSIFVLPYASAAEGEYVRYVGYAQRDKREGDVVDTKGVDDDVAVCLVDLKELIYTYLHNRGNLTPQALIACLK
ncbi:MAG: LlaJI family restriction endonuclease [Clostridiales bacterium]|nr:LlaJI family restriction endonuclease [Clostridiales bacterium]